MLPNEIIVVSGLPRSGTSLMMQMLAAGGVPVITDQVRQADEDNPGGYFELEAVKKLKAGQADWLAAAEGQAVKVISPLLPHLPGSHIYRVILMQRRMEEVLASQRVMLRNRDQAASAGGPELELIYQKHLAQVRNWLAGQPNISYLEVDYNRLVEAPDPVCEQVNVFLEGRLDTLRMRACVDPQLYRQRFAE